MKELPFKALIQTSGVRGRNVYQLTTRRHLVTGAGNSLDIVIQQRSPACSKRFSASGLGGLKSERSSGALVGIIIS